MSKRPLLRLTLAALLCFCPGASLWAKPKNTTGTVLTSTPNPAPFSAAVSLTATVTAYNADGYVPTGTVTFRDGATTLGVSPVSGGTAVLSISTLSAGSHSLTAVYSGDSQLSGSTSAILIQVVAAAAAKANQTISFNHPHTQIYGVAPFALEATASSGLPVTFTLVSGPATLSGNIITITGTGSIRIEASQPGNEAFNPAPIADRSFTVLPPSLAITGITADDKSYDGTTAATLDTSAAALIGILPGDDVTLNTSAAAGAFADKNVGTDKLVTISGITLEGADAPKYQLVQPTDTASIAPAEVTGTVTVNDKFYDGTTAAVISTACVNGAVNGESVSLSCSAANFCDPEAGMHKLVTVEGLSLAGADVGNYVLASPTTTTTASILVASAPSVSVSINAGALSVAASGTSGQTFYIQATASLTEPNWTTISTNVIGEDGTCTFVDPDSAQYPARFYRTMVSF